MTAALDIHPATSDELAAAHRNVHDIWNKGMSVDEHVRYRLSSPSHSRATWYVGTLDGRVVTSLGCYPIRFRVLGRDLRAIAIGSVYTLGEFRGRSFAPQLIEWVEQHERERGASMSVLYSDIEPQYYARRGYTLCPSFEGWCAPGQTAPLTAGEPRLVDISPDNDLAACARLYAEYHGKAPLSFARDDEYWAALVKKAPNDRFYALEDDKGTWLGYVRVGTKGSAWRITDFALCEDSDARAEQLYRALIDAARTGGAARVGGWLPQCSTAKKFFELAPRRAEITMIKPLTSDVRITPELVAATNRFCEIDHV